jgi:hypothetical protein
MTVREIEVKPSWLMGFRAWWAFMWRMVAFSMLAGPVFSYLINTWGERNEILFHVLTTLTGLVILVVDICIMRQLLKMRFGAFRIAVLKSVPEEPS